MYLLELHHCKKKMSPFEPPWFSTGVGHLCSLITEDEEQKFPCRLDFAGRNFCNSLTRNFTQKMSIVFPCCPLRLRHSILLWFVHGDIMQRREIQVSSSLQLLSPFSFNLSKLKDQQVLPPVFFLAHRQAHSSLLMGRTPYPSQKCRKYKYR